MDPSDSDECEASAGHPHRHRLWEAAGIQAALLISLADQAANAAFWRIWKGDSSVAELRREETIALATAALCFVATWLLWKTPKRRIGTRPLHVLWKYARGLVGGILYTFGFVALATGLGIEFAIRSAGSSYSEFRAGMGLPWIIAVLLLGANLLYLFYRRSVGEKRLQ